MFLEVLKPFSLKEGAEEKLDEIFSKLGIEKCKSPRNQRKNSNVPKQYYGNESDSLTSPDLFDRRIKK